MWQSVAGPQPPPWQHIISSPLRRCYEFAESFSSASGIPLAADTRLKEVGFGDWEGKSSTQIKSIDPESISRFYHDPIKYRPAGAESLEDFSQRVNHALDDCLVRYTGKHTLIIAHAGVIRAIVTRVLSAPLGSMYRISIATASITRLQMDDERPLTLLYHGKKQTD
jgi:alpha-ribazole phosphatase/probable phosphoglycerate mutase